MTVKTSDRCDKHGHYFLCHIFYSFYNRFIKTLVVEAELDIPVLINLHDVLMHLYSNFYGTQFLGFGKSNLHNLRI